VLASVAFCSACDGGGDDGGDDADGDGVCGDDGDGGDYVGDDLLRCLGGLLGELRRGLCGLVAYERLLILEQFYDDTDEFMICRKKIFG
jgi:hypothetical protein